MPNADGETGWLGKFMVDITARKRAEQRAQLFAELGSRLDASGRDGSAEARMSALVDTLVPEPCSSVSVRLRTPAGDLEDVATRGTGGEVVHSVPLLARGRDLGTIELTLSDPGEPEEDRTFAAEIARRAALAVDGARLFEGERRARERTERQYAVAAALAEALEPSAVAAVTLHEIIPAVRAEQGTMWLFDEEEGLVTCIGWQGFTDEEMHPHLVASIDDRRPVADAIRSRRMIHLPDATSMAAAYPELAPGLAAAGLNAMVVFPLVTAGRVAGGLLVTAKHEHAFGEDDLALGTALSAQAGQALERARLFESERRVSVTLQRSLLPASLPEVEGVELDLRYLPAAGLEAGGDFYEAVPLADGSLVVAVGDVVGRGANAAAAMGQLRSALRAFALTGDDPGALLTRLSAFADTVTAAMAATAVVAKLDPAAGKLVYACAGHPWPVYTTADGRSELLQGGRGVPLGCLPEPVYHEDVIDLTPDATLLLYTDGLTERRGEDMDAALERLRVTVGECAGAPLAGLLDHAVEDAGPVMPADDVALVVLRFTGALTARRLSFPAQLDSVPAARHTIRDWLGELGVAPLPVGDVLLAAGEAIANAVEHAGAEAFELELASPAPGAIRIVVRDDGHWKDPVVSPHRGRGFGLMRTLVDECTVQRTEQGTVVRLTHRVELDPMPEPFVEPPELTGCTVTVDGKGSAALAGELDLSNAETVALELTTAELHTVDLTGVTHLDSTGARMLYELPARPVFIAPPGSASRRTLDLSSLAGVMSIRDQ